MKNGFKITEETSAFSAAIFFLLLFSPTALSQESKKDAPSSEEISRLDETSKLRDSHILDMARKDFEISSARIDAQDKRIDTQNSHIDHSLTILGIALTILGILFTAAGLIGYFSVQRKAREEAKREAENASKMWLKSKSRKLEGEIALLHRTVSELQARAKSTFDTHVQKVQEDAEKAIDAIQKTINIHGAASIEISKKDALALTEVAKAATDKPESSYSFSDWNNRAFNAYKNGEKEEAARFWRLAASQPGVNPAQAARALNNSGFSLSEINKIDDAISSFDDVIGKFAEKSSWPIVEQVIEAKINRAVQLGKKGDRELELSIYDNIIDEYKDRTDNAYRRIEAIVLGNKGTALAQLKKPGPALDLLLQSVSRLENNHLLDDDDTLQRILKIKLNAGLVLIDLDRIDESINYYDEIISAASSDMDQLGFIFAAATNGKGYARLLQAKKDWEDPTRIAQLEESLVLFEQSVKYDDSLASAHGNLAYCLFLLERPTAEVQRSLSHAFQIGGNHLYEATIEDTKINTVPQLDQNFLMLMEDVWRGTKLG